MVVTAAVRVTIMIVVGLLLLVVGVVVQVVVVALLWSWLWCGGDGGCYSLCKGGTCNSSRSVLCVVNIFW